MPYDPTKKIGPGNIPSTREEHEAAARAAEKAEGERVGDKVWQKMLETRPLDIRMNGASEPRRHGGPGNDSGQSR
jgi:hypothetical protein